MSCRTATFAAMQSASADLPIDGRAATMIRLPGWKPDGEPVEVAEAGRRAGDVAAGLVELGDRLERLLEQLVDVRELASRRAAARGRRRSDSARSTSSTVSPGRSKPSRAMSLPARISPRSVAISLTIRA